MAGDRPSELVDRAYQVGAAATAATVPLADRRGLIRALGIIQIVLGILCCAGFMIVFGVASQDAAIPLSALAIYGVPAANLLLTGIGSVKVARWARRVTLISAFIWLGFIGLLGVVAVARGRGGMPYEVWLTIGVLVAGLVLAVALVASYTRPSVRATFERGQTS